MYKYIYIYSHQKNSDLPTTQKRWGASPVTASTDAQGIPQNPMDYGRTHHGWNGLERGNPQNHNQN